MKEILNNIFDLNFFNYTSEKREVDTSDSSNGAATNNTVNHTRFLITEADSEFLYYEYENFYILNEEFTEKIKSLYNFLLISNNTYISSVKL
jgi:hypothetical protein